MEAKIVKIRVNTTRKYLALFNGIFKLTPKEQEVLAVFIHIHQSLKDQSLQINPFSTEMKKKAAKVLKKDDFNTLNIYIKRLVEKKAISKTTDGYKINHLLVPDNEKRVIFELIK